ncbi:putative TTC5, OB domain superfamily protein [Helianthus anomalus]
MINLFDKLDSLLKPSYKRATIDNLLDGLNKTIAVVGKVLFFIKHENITPL